MKKPLMLNGWSVTSDQETFRIFPKDKRGNTRPITRINQFLYLQGSNGQMITFKRYLHQGQWYWRSSQVNKPIYDLDVRDELSRLLFPLPNARNGEGHRVGCYDKTTTLMLQWISGKDLAEAEASLAA
jgi:hypothetical protein